jgi:hypothetical protein
MSSRAPPAGAPRRPPSSPFWYLILLPPFVGLLWVPFYNSVEPSLGGVPFFYWYQSAWILVSTALTAAVYFATRDDS